MRLMNLMNAAYIYERREHIVPFIKTQANRLIQPVLNLPHTLAAHGFPVTANDRKLAALKDKHKGQRCFVIGNGPSLRISDLDRLKGEITFAANKIYLAFDRTDWRPTYYNVEDNLVIQQNYEAINSLHGFTKLLRWLPNGLLSGGENTIWYEMHVLPSSAYPDFSPSPLDGLSCGYSVTYTSLQFAYFMGCAQIYLIGVDFSFSISNVDKNGRVVSGGEINHFVPNYYKKGELWYPPRLELQEQALIYARDYCVVRGLKIFNATRGGKLEVFPRVDLDRLLQ